MINKIKFILGGFFTLPLIGFAVGEVEDLGGVISKAKDLLSGILPLVMTLALLYFLWSLANYMLKAGEEQAAAREQMLWGIIILFVMVSVWGLVNILSGTIFG